MESQTETDRFLLNAGPRGYGYSYVSVLSDNLLSFLEEKEWMEVEKGNFVIGEDISAIRREAARVKKSISVCVIDTSPWVSVMSTDLTHGMFL